MTGELTPAQVATELAFRAPVPLWQIPIPPPLADPVELVDLDALTGPRPGPTDPQE